jgi:hypothetical protein
MPRKGNNEVEFSCTCGVEASLLYPRTMMYGVLLSELIHLIILALLVARLFLVFACPDTL